MLSDEGQVVIRNVSLGSKTSERKVFKRKAKFYERLFGRYDYQIIRRSVSEELSFFNEFSISKKGFIPNTSYVYYVLNH
jgi:hypothetical protein